MKKVLIYCLVAMMMCGVLGLTATASAEDPYADLEPIEIMVLNNALIDIPSGIMMEALTKDINETSGGKITFNVVYGATNAFGSEEELFDMVRSGSAQIGMTQFPPMNSVAPEVDVFAWPYVFESSAHVSKFFESDDAKPILDKIENGFGLKVLAVPCSGCRNMTTNGIEVRRPEDLKGVKIRCMNSAIYVDGINAMGATAVPVAWAELYFALQTGVVNGQENPGSVIQEGKLNEVQDTLILTEHLYTPVAYVMNQTFWNSLPEAYQTLIAEKFVEHCNAYAEGVVESDRELNEWFGQNGMNLIKDIDQAAFIDATKAVFMEKYADQPDFIALYNAIKAAK